MKRDLLLAVGACLVGASVAFAQDPATDPAMSAEDAPYSPRLPAPATTPPPAPVMPTVLTAAPPVVDSQVTETSLSGAQVFGQWLFQGKFAAESFRGFNPDYVVAAGDIIDLKLWGAYAFQAQLEVDAQGNIFVPQVGPVPVANTRNAELNNVVRSRVKQVYREDVGVYASLAAAQPVKVFVSGYVKRPGLYAASASDSLLHFLDRAGGIDPKSGSYLDVRVLRGGELVRSVNLYDFLLSGKLPLVQFRDGDSLFVGPIQSTVLVTGLVATPTQFEFVDALSLETLLRMAGVNDRATNVRVTRNRGSRRDVEYLAINEELRDVAIHGGAEVEVLADRLIGNIIVQVEGEHEGSGSFVLPYRATLKDLYEKVQFSDRSERAGVQLFRKSIALRQKQMLDETLRKLEAAVLSARSATKEEALLRTAEAQLVLQFIERARRIEPRGQVVLPVDIDPSTIALEDGDVMRVPRQSALVAVHGEVYFPNSFVYRRGLEVENYIKQAGGLTHSADDDRILIMRPNGEVLSTSWNGFMDFTHVQAGDEVLVLPQVDSKNFQLTKDLVEVIYQIAVAAGVVLAL